MSTGKRLVMLVIILVIAGGVSFAGGHGGAMYQALPVFVICTIVAFLINWIVFIPSNIGKTEKYFDLTGSLTYLSVVAIALYLTPNLSIRAKIAAVMVALWATRLGLFLFTRVQRAGHDDRFDKIKVNPLRFFIVWSLQALWVIMTAACALVIITGGSNKEIGLVGMVGIGMWVIGFLIEIIADAQKSAFKKDAKNSGRFITSGLWSWSRHPNYFGEILLWCGMAVLAIPVMSGWQYVALISPVFVFLLLTKMSGIPGLEAKGKAKWGDEPAYQKYMASTSKLIPLPPKN